jgi:hypothetical protein
MFGRIFGQITARFKVCEHCAENIKLAAKVCRYCGRDVQFVSVDEGASHLEGFDPALVTWMKRRHPKLTDGQIAKKISESSSGGASK